jgi:hypothetical protein
MTAKKTPARCESRGLKAESKNTRALYTANAFENATHEFQTSRIVRRFGLAPSLAAILAELAFSNGRAA